MTKGVMGEGVRRAALLGRCEMRCIFGGFWSIRAVEVVGETARWSGIGIGTRVGDAIFPHVSSRNVLKTSGSHEVVLPLLSFAFETA